MFLFFLGLVTIFHLWFINSGPFNLAPDEAHHWTWSKRLDWSYYSKGWMMVYLIALSTRVGGDTEFFIRLPAVLLLTGTALLTFLLAQFGSAAPLLSSWKRCCSLPPCRFTRWA